MFNRSKAKHRLSYLTRDGRYPLISLFSRRKARCLDPRAPFVLFPAARSLSSRWQPKLVRSCIVEIKKKKRKKEKKEGKKEKKKRREGEKSQIEAETVDTPAASSWTYFLASREGTWVAAWHFAGFMRPLRIVPGPVPPPTSTPSFSLDSSVLSFLFPFLSVSTRVLLWCTRGRNFFCRVAITRQSPLPFGTVDGCPLRGLRRSSLPNGLRPTLHGRLLPHEKTRVHLCKSSTPHGHARLPRIYERENATISFVLCFAARASSNTFFLSFFLSSFWIVSLSFSFSWFRFSSSGLMRSVVSPASGGGESDRYTHPAGTHSSRTPLEETG